MKTWKKGLIFSLVWIALTIAGGIVHTEYILAGRITPSQDAALSARYGNACVVGLMVIWITLYSRKQPKR
jgi:hypothetical protein